MPNDNKPGQEADSEDPKLREDGPIPTASDDEVLDDTARLVREGRKELRRDPNEPKRSQD